MPHIPVLLQEVLEALDIQDNKKYLDCTFGAGGYSRGILQKNGTVFACDQDISTKKYFDILEKEFSNKIKFYHSNFADVDELLIADGINNLDGIVMDLGVSSMQIDTPERGFSFNKDGPLDMRMDQNSEKNAYDFINNASFDELADVIYYYGDEWDAKKISRAIIKKREIEEIKTTLELAKIIHSAVGFNKKQTIDPATKTFQAIRIFVNNEMNNLIECLQKLSKILNINGKIITVTFHSIEDNIVKKFFQSVSKKEKNSTFKLIDDAFYKNYDFEINGKIVLPSQEEIKNNIRSRSAKMRVLRRVK